MSKFGHDGMETSLKALQNRNLRSILHKKRPPNNLLVFILDGLFAHLFTNARILPPVFGPDFIEQMKNIIRSSS